MALSLRIVLAFAAVCSAAAIDNDDNADPDLLDPEDRDLLAPAPASAAGMGGLNGGATTIEPAGTGSGAGGTPPNPCTPAPVVPVTPAPINPCAPAPTPVYTTVTTTPYIAPTPAPTPVYTTVTTTPYVTTPYVPPATYTTTPAATFTTTPGATYTTTPAATYKTTPGATYTTTPAGTYTTTPGATYTTTPAGTYTATPPVTYAPAPAVPCTTVAPALAPPSSPCGTIAPAFKISDNKAIVAEQKGVSLIQRMTQTPITFGLFSLLLVSAVIGLMVRGVRRRGSRVSFAGRSMSASYDNVTSDLECSNEPLTENEVLVQ